LVKVSGAADVGENALVVSNLRHYDALVQAGEAISRVIDGLNAGISADFVALDIRQCQHFLGEITGTFTNHEILGYIFKNFCIGK
jgi:tRNA modification GTPase